MTTQYALESKGCPLWHVVKVASQVSNAVLGLCGHSFSNTRRLTSERPHTDVLCAGCRGVEKRQAETSSQEGEADVCGDL